MYDYASVASVTSQPYRSTLLFKIMGEFVYAVTAAEDVNKDKMIPSAAVIATNSPYMTKSSLLLYLETFSIVVFVLPYSREVNVSFTFI